MDPSEIVDLRAEIDTLRDVASIRQKVLSDCLAEQRRLAQADRQWADHVKRLSRERDMLRAERTVWGNIAQERNELRAEIEALKRERDDLLDKAWDAAGEGFRQLQAELQLAREQAENFKEDWLKEVAEVERLRAELRTCQETLTACLESS